MRPSPLRLPLERRRQDGFSLIELLLATFLLGLTIVGLTQAMTSSLQSSVTAEEYTRAVRLAENVMAELRVEKFVTEGETEGEFESSPGFTSTTKVESGEFDGLYQITVEIKSEGELVYTLGTYRFELPVDDDYREYVEESTGDEAFR